MKAARKRAELSQADLAEKLGVVPSTVAGWESGTHGIRLKHLAQLSELLGAPMQELVA